MDFAVELGRVELQFVGQAIAELIEIIAANYGSIPDLTAGIRKLDERFVVFVSSRACLDAGWRRSLWASWNIFGTGEKSSMPLRP